MKILISILLLSFVACTNDSITQEKELKTRTTIDTTTNINISIDTTKHEYIININM